jgi:hypothetical protein
VWAHTVSFACACAQANCYAQHTHTHTHTHTHPHTHMHSHTCTHTHTHLICSHLLCDVGITITATEHLVECCWILDIVVRVCYNKSSVPRPRPLAQTQECSKVRSCELCVCVCVCVCVYVCVCMCVYVYMYVMYGRPIAHAYKS